MLKICVQYHKKNITLQNTTQQINEPITLCNKLHQIIDVRKNVFMFSCRALYLGRVKSLNSQAVIPGKTRA